MRVIDRMNANSSWQLDKDHVIHPYTDFATFHEQGSQIITKSEGNYIIDSNGERYLDGIAGLWCVNIGHAREEMADAIAAQVRKMQYYNPFGHTGSEPAAELAAKLAALSPGTLNHVFFTCGGSTANDSAMRVIHYYNNLRGKPNKKHIISRLDGYHGSTYVAANLTGIHGTKNSFDGIGKDWISHVSAASMYRRPPGAEELSDGDYANFLCNELEARILQLGADNVAAFIMEPIMGAGGVLVAPDGYHKKVADLCHRYDVLVVADEVVTAFGRLGAWVASEELYDFQPDVLILAKGINSGYVPLGAALFSDEIYEVISKPQCEDGVFSMGFTYTGHAVACAAALKNIDIMEREKLAENVLNLGPYLQSEAAKLLDSAIVGDVRGRGFMLGIELVKSKTTREALYATMDVFKNCLRRGVVIRPVGNTIIVSPPLTLTKENIDTIITSLKYAFAEVVAEM